MKIRRMNAYIYTPCKFTNLKEENMSSSSEYRKGFVSGQRDYWRQVAKSDGFNITDVSVPQGTTGLLPFDCQRPHFRLVSCFPKYYAMVGLHRYNMLKGTNFQFSSLLNYNKSMNCVASYYITLVAQDLPSQLQKTFQVRVDEKSYGKLDLRCSLARPEDGEEVTTKKPFIPHFHGEAAPDDDFYKGKLPDWPSVDDFNDQKRFYLVNESEVQANDWIRLYLELALCVDGQWTMRKLPSLLSKLQILKVAIETKEDVQPPSGKLESKCAHVYITFKGLAKGPIGEDGEDVERKAIVRRVIHERSGNLTLLGGFSIGEEALNTVQPLTLQTGEDQALDNEQSSEKRRCLD